jgi:hypothetical protein
VNGVFRATWKGGAWPPPFFYWRTVLIIPFAHLYSLLQLVEKQGRYAGVKPADTLDVRIRAVLDSNRQVCTDTHDPGVWPVFHAMQQDRLLVERAVTELHLCIPERGIVAVRGLPVACPAALEQRVPGICWRVRQLDLNPNMVEKILVIRSRVLVQDRVLLDVCIQVHTLVGKCIETERVFHRVFDTQIPDQKIVNATELNRVMRHARPASRDALDGDIGGAFGQDPAIGVFNYDISHPAVEYPGQVYSVVTRFEVVGHTGVGRKRDSEVFQADIRNMRSCNEFDIPVRNDIV